MGLHTRLYIVQLVGILMLICGYFLSDQPDSLSVMHFDPNPACPAVISKATPSSGSSYSQVSASSQNNTSHRTIVPTYISFELLLTNAARYHFHQLSPVKHTIALPESYNYLFFEEINPPPPKDC